MRGIAGAILIAVAGAASAATSTSTSTATPPAASTVASIDLVLPPGEDAAALWPLVTLRRGEPLAAREVRRTVQLLFATGRFANVVARARPAEGGGAAVTLECLPRTTAAAVEVDAGPAPPLDPERVRRAAGIAPGDELWPGRLDEAAARVRALHARHGYPAAEVTVTAAGAPAAQVLVRVAPGAPARVAAVELIGETGLPPAALLQGLATQPGAVLDQDLLEADARAMRGRLRRAGWLRARVGAPQLVPGEQGTRVRLPVDAGAEVAVRFTGAASASHAALREALALEAEPVLDATALAAAAGRIRAWYLARGHASVRVDVREVPARRGTALVFAVEEGRRYHVSAVRFSGAGSRDPRWLRARLDEALDALAPAGPTGPAADAERLALAAGSPAVVRSPPALEPRAAWNPPLWDEAALRIVETYRAEGWLEASYDGTRATLDAAAGTVEVELRFREGVRTLVDAVTFEGNRAVSTAELAKEARLAAGDPLAFGAVEATRAALLGLYARRGHVFARVAEREEASPDRTRARVRFTIEEGPQVRVGAVVVSGARRTREAVVRESLALKAGDVYDPDAAVRSQAALLRLGVFRSVALRLAEPELVSPVKDVQVDLAERPWRTLSPGIGFSLANGPRAFVELTQPNLLGRALELSARAKVNYPLVAFRRDLEGTAPGDRFEGRLDVGLQDPRVRVLGLAAAGRVNGILERLHRPAYDLARGSTIVGIELPLAARVTLGLQSELEIDHIVVKPSTGGDAVLTRADVERLRFPEGVTTLASVRPVLAIDFRDDPAHPRRGWLATGVADYSHSLGGLLGGVVPGSDVFTHMLRLSGALSGYLPLGPTVVATSLRGGRVLPLDRDSQTIGPKRFFLGGAASMRGFGEDEMIPEDVRGLYLQQVRACAASISRVACSPAALQLANNQFLTSEGGESFVNAKIELRFPISEHVEGGLFTDAGNLWLDPRVGRLTDLRWNFGAGLRFLTPIGPAVLDVGVNPFPDGRLGETYLAPHFSIGLF